MLLLLSACLFFHVFKELKRISGIIYCGYSSDATERTIKEQHMWPSARLHISILIISVIVFMKMKQNIKMIRDELISYFAIVATAATVRQKLHSGALKPLQIKCYVIIPPFKWCWKQELSLQAHEMILVKPGAVCVLLSLIALALDQCLCDAQS